MSLCWLDCCEYRIQKSLLSEGAGEAQKHRGLRIFKKFSLQLCGLRKYLMGQVGQRWPLR